MSAPAMPAARTGRPATKQSLRVWLRLLKASGTIEQVIRRRLRDEHGTTLPRFDVLAALERNPQGLKMSEVSGLLRVSNGNITGIVERLVEEGLVSREAVPGDRRAFKVCLTPAGREIFALQAAAHAGWIEDLFAGLDAAAMRDFSGMLDAVNHHLEEVEGKNGAR